MSIEPLRLDEAAMTTPVVMMTDTPSVRVKRLTADASCVINALENTRLRFSLIAPRSKRLRII